MDASALEWKQAGIGTNLQGGSALWEHALIRPIEINTVAFWALMMAPHGFVLRDGKIKLERISIFDSCDQKNPPSAILYQIPWQSEDFFINGTVRLHALIGQWAKSSVRDVEEAVERNLSASIVDALALCPFTALHLWPGMEEPIPEGEGQVKRAREMAVKILEPLRGLLPSNVEVQVPYATRGGRGGIRTKIAIRRFKQSELIQKAVQ